MMRLFLILFLFVTLSCHSTKSLSDTGSTINKSKYIRNVDIARYAKIKTPECSPELFVNQTTSAKTEKQTQEPDLSNSGILKYKKKLFKKVKTVIPKNQRGDLKSIIFSLNYIEKIKEPYLNQPEVKLTYDIYLSKVVTPEKIKNAKQFISENKEMLEQIEKKYQVEKELIVALATMETHLGRITGNYNTLDSLFSLAISSSRHEFFESELIEMLKIILKDVGVTRENKGSWAGAFGMVQFMPSTFAKFAVDYDKNGIIDLLSVPDAMASAANYISSVGWKYKNAFATEIDKTSIQSYCKAGSEYRGGIIVIPDKSKDSRVYIAFENYGKILEWNRSLLFATAVYQIYENLD